jgi:hypothetical protein
MNRGLEHTSEGVSEDDPSLHRQATVINRKSALLLAGIVLATYAPAFNNGFISDDYVVLERLRTLKRDPLYLFSVPPDNFRYTAYLAFAVLKTLFGYRPACFYAFTILLHTANALLLARVLQRAGASAGTALAGAVLFASIQNPQEALMWLSAMNEALLGTFMLCTLLAWLDRRYVLAAGFYVLALFSKESAVALLALVPLAEYRRDRKLDFQRRYIYLLLPALLVTIVFLLTRHANELLKQYYAIGPAGLEVEVRTLHRLFFPWIYLAVVILLAGKRMRTPGTLPAPAAWVALALLPYVFLTYQNHVPSRNQYVACMGLAWLLAELVEKLPRVGLRRAFIAAFVVSNAAYIWLAKDSQYEERAAPTSRLVAELRAHPPEPLLILNFPLNPWIAKDTALEIPGWRPELITVNEPPETCKTCRILSWDARSRHYSTLR